MGLESNQRWRLIRLSKGNQPFPHPIHVVYHTIPVLSIPCDDRVQISQCSSLLGQHLLDFGKRLLVALGVVERVMGMCCISQGVDVRAQVTCQTFVQVRQAQGSVPERVLMTEVPKVEVDEAEVKRRGVADEVNAVGVFFDLIDPVQEPRHHNRGVFKLLHLIVGEAVDLIRNWLEVVVEWLHFRVERVVWIFVMDRPNRQEVVDRADGAVGFNIDHDVRTLTQR